MADVHETSTRVDASASPSPLWRWVAAALSVVCTTVAVRSPRTLLIDAKWYWLAAALLLAITCTLGLNITRPVVAVPRGWRWWRVAVGSLLALAAAATFAHATYALYLNWVANFDQTWLTWVGATAVMAVGLDLASGPWTRVERTVIWRYALIMIVLVLVTALYRLGNIAEFPGEGTATQVEDLQTGQWGYWYWQGLGRLRWEYLSHQWLAAVGIWGGGPSMTAMRIPFAAVSALKTAPLFIWLLLSVGPVGAIVGTALFACSAWDTVLSRTANNQNTIIVATAFALLAGPARRGRPSAYVCFGLLGGYLWHEYVAYRPAIGLMLIGAWWLSIRDRGAPWLARLGRPLVPAIMIVAMALPLFLGRLSDGRVWDEYFNGWNRARAIQPYYNEGDSWRVAVDKRIDRSFDALSLFFFSGDNHPARRVNQPLVDPITGTLLVLGVGCAIAHWTQPVLGLTAAGLLITIVGTLVMTGNFDIGRVGGAVPYVFACVGFGAAGLDAIVRGRSRSLRLVLWAVLALAVAWAGYLNTRALFRYWSSPSVHRALRHNLAYLSTWLGQNIRPDEQVIALAPGLNHVLQENDAAWLRGRDMNGIAAWDLETALRYWTDHRGKAALVLFAGTGTPTVQRYVESLFPGVQMQFVPDPLKLEGDVAFAHLDDTPPQLANVLSTMRCRGLASRFTFVGHDGTEAFTLTSGAPFVDAPAIPSEVRTKLFQANPPPLRVTARFSGRMAIAKAGEYRFTTQVYPGSGLLTIDKKSYGGGADRGIPLTAGEHEIELQVTFDPDPLTMVARLYWQGPDSGGEREIVPFYRITVPDPACVAAAAPGGGSPAPQP